MIFWEGKYKLDWLFGWNNGKFTRNKTKQLIDCGGDTDIEIYSSHIMNFTRDEFDQTASTSYGEFTSFCSTDWTDVCKKLIMACRVNFDFVVPFNVLIATAFIPNPDNLPQVDHINNNKQDNRVCNLKWVSCSDNNHNKGMNPKNKSGTKGVCKKDNKWKAYITVKNISYEKIFDTKEEAIKCRKEYEEKYLSHLK